MCHHVFFSFLDILSVLPEDTDEDDNEEDYEERADDCYDDGGCHVRHLTHMTTAHSLSSRIFLPSPLLEYPENVF